SRIGLYNSTMDSAGSTYHLVKQNVMSKLLSNQVLGTISDVKNASQLVTNDFSYYANMNATVSVNIAGTSFAFNLSAPITPGTVNLIGYAEVQGTIYMCAFHYAYTVPANSTLEIYSLPAFTKVTPVSYSITATVSDK
ncbi:hypothetical protein WP50_05145, partial [Lactiplantibacillus plantarum]